MEGTDGNMESVAWRQTMWSKRRNLTRQCGTYFIKDGKTYTLRVKDLRDQAKKANIDY